MGRMIDIQMDSDDMINMLNERVGYWTDDSEVAELFDQYYTNAVENGCFDGSNFDVRSIVDNDYVNNTSIMTREEYEKAREDYIKEYMDLDGFSDDDRPKAEDYSEDEQDDFIAESKDFEVEKAEALQDYEDNTPTFDDLEVGDTVPDFISGYTIEAKTSSSILISY